MARQMFVLHQDYVSRGFPIPIPIAVPDVPGFFSLR